ncbi:Ca-activated chloride channel family protein [Planifilum fimeticola]|uniref:Ca-activated chloride channel family protein n=1 Tax=Planifilum fimeticola TaxID=201975 RepID=A0A2T0LCY9_9BACL|nr:VWA domain-containing protein [Planifilum fimeticola]PRX39846.1 Ca-activated chloride channel family protein [Planifilum fimeticola]
MKRLFSGMLILCLLFSSGCSLLSSQDNTADKDKPNKEEVKKAATDVEGMLREGPGKYAGDKYDEEKVKAELDKLPDNMTTDEAYNHLVALLAEDYKPEVKALDELDPTIRTDRETPGDVNAPEEGELPKQVNVEILLDASGSMAGRVSGGVKMDLAKDAIRKFASKLPEGARVALRVYGHKGSNQQKDKALSCKSTEMVYPLGEYDKSSFQKSLNKFRPTGWTPLAAAIEQAKSDLSGKTGENVENIIYVVSDGIETCGGDPVKAAKELHDSEIQAIVNIIGFDVDNAGQRALKKVAEAGGGEYATVNTGDDLQRHLEKEYRRLRSEWLMWGIDSASDARKMWGDKIDVLNETIDKIRDKYNREKGRMTDAKDYLNSIGKLKASFELSNKISNRWLKLYEYTNKRSITLRDQLWNARMDEEDRVKEKARDMQEKYEQ